MGEALAKTTGVQITGIAEVFRLADHLAQAVGFVPAAYLGKPNAIAAAMLTGIEIGMGPLESLREIHIVQGRPTLSSASMLARAIRAGIKVEWLEATDKAARLRLTRGTVSYEQSWTMEDAKRADLANKSGPWKTYPAAMLRARAISAAVRAFCPDVIGGGGLYTPEEAGDMEPERRPASVETHIVDDRHDDASETRALPPETRPAAIPLDDITDEADLREYAGRFGATLTALVNGRRKAAQDKVRAAADRCGIAPDEALHWCGLLDEVAA